MRLLKIIPEFLRAKVREPRMSRIARWIMLFCLGWYAAELTHKAPSATEAVVEAVQSAIQPK